jgi:hydrogenase maturation factor
MDAAALSARLRREEPRRMTDDLAPTCEHDRGCVTCGDEAIRMKVIHIDPDRELALCAAEEGQERSTVEIALVQPVSEGDLLLVHAGTAIAHAAREVAA